ncbi:DUF4178 domain-containing protein [Sphingomonas sp. HMP6]|uniref:DUF4178 domain-containing protein n=1 Tax=Sphingomonas sp. HMP6 TaxID=1517551 RepID=UPI001596BF68|nr:DUF4178 domain-containing protein [Sphingomonas sp. HMP6]BCA60669.1 hypothetical protein HMP06_3438 [Sphingomonas sp. HMP6]
MTVPLNTVRALTCPNCGGTIALRAAGNTVSIICEHCGTTLDATSPDLAPIAQATTAMQRPEIALGTRGTLRGVQWEVVGYLERTDHYVNWSEYLLFNPYQGYAFLVDDERRFSLGVLLTQLPGYTGGSITVDDVGYTRFGSRYDAWVTFVVGEFYWRVAVQEQVQITDFVRPGTMLSCEENAEERTWTQLTLLDFGEAEAALSIPKRRKSYGGTPAPHEPSPYGNLMKEALIIGVVAAFTLIVIMFMGGGRTELASATLDVALNGTQATRVIGPIDLPGRTTAIRIAARADGIDNSWIELDYSLVNRATQESFDAYATAERYHGVTDGESWREGDATPGVQLSSIPAGQYDLVVEATGHVWSSTTVTTPDSGWGETPAVPVTIDVARGGIFIGNLLLTLFALLCWPVILVLRHIGFETRRLAPVAEEDDE